MVFFLKSSQDGLLIEKVKRLLIEKYAAPMLHKHKCSFQKIVSGRMCKLCYNLNLFSGNFALYPGYSKL